MYVACEEARGERVFLIDSDLNRQASIACVGFFGEIGSVWGIWSQEHDPCRLAILIELDVWYFKHGLAIACNVSWIMEWAAMFK